MKTKNNYKNPTALVAQAARELELILQEIALREQGKDALASLNRRGKSERFVKIMHAHHEEDMMSCRRDRVCVWWKMVGLCILRGVSTLFLGTKFATNTFSPLIDAQREEYRSLFHKECEVRDEVRRWELVLKLHRETDNMDEMP